MGPSYAWYTWERGREEGRCGSPECPSGGSPGWVPVGAPVLQPGSQLNKVSTPHQFLVLRKPNEHGCSYLLELLSYAMHRSPTRSVGEQCWSAQGVTVVVVVIVALVTVGTNGYLSYSLDRLNKAEYPHLCFQTKMPH